MCSALSKESTDSPLKLFLCIKKKVNLLRRFLILQKPVSTVVTRGQEPLWALAGFACWHIGLITTSGASTRKDRLDDSHVYEAAESNMHSYTCLRNKLDKTSMWINHLGGQRKGV